MKHTLKILIPILLILALLIGACYFFLIARRDLTESVFTYWGNHFYNNGRYGRAITCYKLAMHFAPKDAELAIWLSNAYKRSGNYTKAEYTLVNAITQSPDAADLYIALSKTYVEQDKLLDAETMLGRITNDTVRTQIDALRPAAPVIEPESGTYTEYIDVTITGTEGHRLRRLQQRFPGRGDGHLYRPHLLTAGESKIVALSVADNGLVSDAVYAGYTVGSVVEPVTLADAGLDSYVRELLGKTAGSTLMTDELWAIEELDLPDTVASLEDLPYFHRPAHARAAPQQRVDGLVGPRPAAADAAYAGPVRLHALVGGDEHHRLLPELTSLNLSGCAVIDINALIGLQKLEFLDLSNNTISDLTALSALQALKELHLTNNPITSLANLKNCTQLEILYANQCSITRIAGLADHMALKELYLANNQIADISVLASCTALQTLDLSFNAVTDISIVSELRQLVDLNVSNNQITVFPAVDADTPLWHVDISHNQIEDLTGLAGNLSVNFINADYNKIKSIAKLEECVMLVKMNLWDNPVNTDEVKNCRTSASSSTITPNTRKRTQKPEKPAAARIIRSGLLFAYWTRFSAGFM
ncbi:MAG: leucine-rich repeat domain-containing protein [Oscillospiraceae bacterium]